MVTGKSELMARRGKRIIRTGGGIPRLTVEETDAAVAGDLEIWVGIAKACIRLASRKEVEEYAAAKERGWLSISKQQTIPLKNAWFHWCEATNHPYIVVWHSPKHIMMELDLIAQSYQLNDEAVARVLATGEELLTGSRSTQRKRTVIIVGKTVVVLAGLNAEQVPAAATMLLTEGLAAKKEKEAGSKPS